MEPKHTYLCHEPNITGLWSIFLLDINTIVALLIFSSQVDLVQRDDVPPGFIFQAPPKRGRPKGSKSKKGVVAVNLAGQETGSIKMGARRNKKQGSDLISSDPTESSDTGKKSKRETNKEAVVSEIKNITKEEAVDTTSHHRREERLFYVGTAVCLGTLEQSIP